ncbi:MAG: HAD-IA family hydrolase [Patescibacteria group bacterium]|nr:HAD-IA family hydrolase [Patescibacteria group bacterium]MDD5121535.1 HAD-IA family hydrolase [Patescibacteria group bacterium]MDD5222103.1 HAD-IA family hydrolase [Patescibacteria group bacterium]MDD5396301.1 HAD-IA family hydrolase [Patescibacteria group bacterium]
MIKLVIFDLWKTLAYRQVPYSSTSKILEETALNIPKDKFIKIFESSLQTKRWKSKYRAYRNLCHNMGLLETRENIDLLINIRDKAEAKTELYPYTIQLLKQLHKLNYKTALISNSSIFAIKQIKKTKILDYIDYPLFSFQVGVIKPDLKIYRKLLKIAKCKPSEAIMIGDKLGDDVLPPRQLGMHSIHLTTYPKLKKELKKFNILIK